MPESPPPASIALANGVVVRVGDVVPMMDGSTRYVGGIPAKEAGLWLRERGQRSAYWYERDGRYADRENPRPAIDLTKLAEQQAVQAMDRHGEPSLASPPAARQRSGVAEVVDAARELIDELNKPFVVGIDNMAGTKKAIRRTQRALAALDQEARDG